MTRYFAFLNDGNTTPVIIGAMFEIDETHRNIIRVAVQEADGTNDSVRDAILTTDGLKEGESAVNELEFLETLKTAMTSNSTTAVIYRVDSKQEQGRGIQSTDLGFGFPVNPEKLVKLN